MTIAAFMAEFGLDTARYVTQTGRLVSRGVTSTGAGSHAHPVHGQVTAVPNHTFHGGVEDEDPAEPPWWLTDPDEVAWHVDAVHAAFPGFAYRPGTDTRRPAFRGTIDTGRGQFTVTVLLRTDKGLPAVIPDNRLLGRQHGRYWVPAEHLFTNGNLCIADSDEDWDPDTHTAADAIALSAHWFAVYTVWRVVHRWTTPGQHVA